MTREVRSAFLTALLMFSSVAFLAASLPVTAQRSSQRQFRMVLQLTPVEPSSSFSGGTVDMQFTGAERDWNAASGVVELSLVANGALPPDTMFEGGLSWSTSAPEMPVPPNDVTFSLFSNEGEPYRVMIESTTETLFTMLSQSSNEAAMVVHGSIHLHVSVGSLLAVNEMVEVRGHAVYSAVN